MNITEVSRLLESEGVVTHANSVRTTAMYFQLWKEGASFDLSKKQVQVHRARLRKIGIDIAKPYSDFDDLKDFGQ